MLWQSVELRRFMAKNFAISSTGVLPTPECRAATRMLPTRFWAGRCCLRAGCTRSSRLCSHTTTGCTSAPTPRRCCCSGRKRWRYWERAASLSLYLSGRSRLLLLPGRVAPRRAARGPRAVLAEPARARRLGGHQRGGGLLGPLLPLAPPPRLLGAAPPRRRPRRALPRQGLGRPRHGRSRLGEPPRMSGGACSVSRSGRAGGGCGSSAAAERLRSGAPQPGPWN